MELKPHAMKTLKQSQGQAQREKGQSSSWAKSYAAILTSSRHVRKAISDLPDQPICQEYHQVNSGNVIEKKKKCPLSPDQISDPQNFEVQ